MSTRKQTVPQMMEAIFRALNKREKRNLRKAALEDRLRCCGLRTGGSPYSSAQYALPDGSV